MRRSILVFAALAAIGVTAAGVAPPPEMLRQFMRFGDAFAIVQKQYVEPLSDDALIDGALKGLLASLDEHSQYLSRAEFEQLKGGVRQAAVGLEVTNDYGQVKVLRPMPGSPAEASAIRPGDYVEAIDGVAVNGDDLFGAISRMKGAAGSPARLSIRRADGIRADIVVTRGFYEVRAVAARAAGEFGVVEISAFNNDTNRQTVEAVEKLKRELPGMKGLVLDLRNNPGGLVDASVMVAGDFLDGGEVATERGRNPGDVERFTARPNGDLLRGLPMVVLVNQGTALGAEIVAGALKDRGRAAVVGLTTFGGGAVQTVIPLHGGQDGALKLTTARWFTPAGRSLQRVGIEPDLEVARSREEAERLAGDRFQFNESTLPHALAAGDGRSRRPPHPILDFPPQGFDAAKGDYQLERALDVLRAGGDVGKVRKPAGLAVG